MVNGFIGEVSIFSSHQNPDSHKFMKSAIYNDFLSILERLFLNNYELDFFHQGTNRKPDISGGWINWTTNVSEPCIIITIVGKFKKYWVLLICLDNQTLLPQKPQVWFLQPKSPSKIFRFCGTIQITNFMLIHASDLWQSKSSKNCYFFEFARFSYF